SGGVGGAANELRERRPHLAADTEDEDIALQIAHGCDIGLRGARHALFQLFQGRYFHCHPNSNPAMAYTIALSFSIFSTRLMLYNVRRRVKPSCSAQRTATVFACRRSQDQSLDVAASGSSSR